MTTIFEHTDREGDRLTVRTSDHVVPGAVIVEAYDNCDGDLASVRLAPEQIAGLRLALKPFDPVAFDPAPAVPAIEEGKEYRLLPSATFCGGARSDMPKEGTTRVRVLRATPDGDGDVYVEPLDGEAAGKPGNGRYVHPEHLAPIPDLKVGDVVALLPNAKTSSGGGVYFAADVTRVKVEIADDGDDDLRVSNVDGSGLDLGRGRTTGRLGEKQYVARAYLGDPEPAPALKVGDRARVTGDSAEWGHGFTTGEVVTLTEKGDNYVEHESEPRGWHCKGERGVEWYVHADDLAPLDEPAPSASDEAVAMVADEALWDVAAEPEELDDLRVRAVEKALELIGASDFDDVEASEIIAVAAYIAGEIDADEADA